MDMRIASATDKGRIREINEDSVLAELPLVAVADGMGGHVAGEVASSLAVDVLKTWKERIADRGSKSVPDILREAFREVNTKVAERGSSDESLHGMGTTLTAAWVDDGSATVAHVGDSRAYLLRGGDFNQITQDQTVAQEWVRRGRISEDEAATSPQRHVLLQAIGAEGSDLDIEIATLALEPGDRLLLVSDGLSGMIRDDEIKMILTDHRDLNAASRALIDAANAAGGQDNISVLIIEAEGEPAAAADAKPLLVEKPVTEKKQRRVRPVVVLGAVAAIVAIAGLALFFFVGVSTKSYVVAARRGHVVILHGHAGTDDKPPNGKVVREYRKKRVDRYAEPAQEQLQTGIEKDTLVQAEAVIESLPQKLGANERATPSPSPTPRPSTSVSPKPSVSAVP